MIYKAFKVLAVIMLAALAMAIVAGCGKPGPAETPPEPEYADAIAENLLQSLINTENYTSFIRDFDETMKKAMTEAAFAQTHDDLRAKYGEYQSKIFTLTEEEVQEVYTAVSYNATFGKRTQGITVKVVFQETNQGVFVAGLWFQ
ncbi:MAG: hypothetical protein A2Y92_00060 [Chloroflexi bacterium RBG_13_57_8]|nr:MAG: hypothetical protein A2Y92_00060 [Chloroflexi bacterium RBG_13_57_8]